MTFASRQSGPPIAPSELSYPCGEPPKPGHSRKVAAGVRWVRMPLPFTLDHVNVWLLEDTPAKGVAQWTAVDTGVAIDDIRHHWQRLLATHPLKRQIVTHCHPDHLGLADWLERKTGAPLGISQAEYATAHLIWAQIAGYGIPAMLEFFQTHGLPGETADEIAARGNSFRHNIPEIPSQFQRLRDGDELAIGSRTWQVIAGFGHSPEHTSLYCDELRVLISGDMLLPRISTNVSVIAADPDTNPLGLFLDSIARFKRLPVDTLVLPSHGMPFRGIHARIAQLEAHHRDRCATLLGACATPKTAAELVPVLFSRPIRDAHQIMFAMGEAIAHLNYLESGRALTRVHEGGVIRFALGLH